MKNRRHDAIRFSGLIVAAALAVGVAHAAPDPDLIILHAKVNGVGAQLNGIRNKAAVVDQQLQDLYPIREAGLVGLGDAVLRHYEEILLECAQKGPDCVVPSFVYGAKDPACKPVIDLTEEAAAAPPEHEHDAGFNCPILVLVQVLQSNREVAEAGALARDYAEADRLIADALAAFEAGDGVATFRAACAAYKVLACP